MSFGAALGASIIGGAVGSAISQGIGMAMGVVDKFSWRQVAAGGIGAGLTAGLGHFGHFAKITEGMKWSQAASAYAQNAAMSYSVNQISGRVAGLDTSFSWRSVASTVVGATVGNAAGRGLGLDGGNLWSGVARSVVTGSSQSYFNQQWARGGKLDFVQLAMDSFGNALGNNIVDRMTPTTSAPPVALAKGGQRAMDLDGVNFLDAGVDTSMPDMRWMDDLNTSIAAGSNIAVNANTPGHTAMVQSASQVAVAGGYVDSQNAGLTLEITYNANERTLPESVVTASATGKGGGLLNWLSKPENISFVLDMVPVVGTLKSLYQAGAGRDLITGESVNRWVEGAGIVAGMIPGGKLGVKGAVGAVPNKSLTGPLSAADANAPHLAKGNLAPYAEGTRARDIVLQQERVFSRVHGEGNQAKSWMMRPHEIEGLTPIQIQNKFALPELPSFISDVHVPAGSRVRVGTVAPQTNWGAGGSTQYELLQRLPSSSFQNMRPLP